MRLQSTPGGATATNDSVEILKAEALRCLTTLALCAGALLSPPTVKSADNAPAQSSSKPTLSAGLINDWLRSESESANPWDIGGQVRLRYELKENAGAFPDRDFIAEGQDNDNDVLALRTKLHIGYTPVDWADFFVEGRDSQSWWDDRDPSPEEDSLDLHQAFTVLGNAMKFPLTAKVGRQEMTYGDERFLGVSDWSNIGRVFDAVRVRFENETFWVDAFSGWMNVVEDGQFNEGSDSFWFSGIYASTRKLIPRQETQLFFFIRSAASGSTNAIAPGVARPAPRDISMPGLRVRSLPGAFGNWDYGTEIAGQFGSINSGGQRVDHKAYAADALAGFTWRDAFGTPRLGVEYTYASGDSDPTDNENETFEPLFGTNHKLYGLMDLFGIRNIHNPSVSFSIKPAKGLSLRLDYLAFWLADTDDFLYPETGNGRSSNGYGRNPQFNSYVGSELDFVVTYQPAPWMDLQLGYGHFFVGDYIKQSVQSVPANGGATDADWLYVSAKLTF